MHIFVWNYIFVVLLNVNLPVLFVKKNGIISEISKGTWRHVYYSLALFKAPNVFPLIQIFFVQPLAYSPLAEGK